MFNNFIELNCVSSGDGSTGPGLINIFALTNVKKDANTGFAILQFGAGQTITTTQPYEEVAEQIKERDQQI